MNVITMKITKKGQVTIPKKVRKILKSELISFIIEGDTIKIVSAQQDTYGRLKKYAQKYLPFETVRQETWEAVVNEAAKEGISN